MYTLQKLEIYGYQQEAVPHTFFQQNEPTDHVAMVFPGLEYTCQGPVLNYPSQELLMRRADVLWVEYDQRPGFATLSPEELQQCCVTDAVSAYQALLRQRTYRQITLIGKSLGTAVMAYLLTAQAMPVLTQAIWLTPLLRMQELRTQMQRAGRRSFIVIGTADPQYDPALLAEVKQAIEGDVLVIEQVGHDLQSETSVLQSLEIMEQLIRSLQTFLGGEQAKSLQ